MDGFISWNIKRLQKIYENSRNCYVKIKDIHNLGYQLGKLRFLFIRKYKLFCKIIYNRNGHCL